MPQQELDDFRKFLHSMAPLPETEWDACQGHLDSIRLESGEALVMYGGPCNRVGYVRSGLLKTFYLTSKGTEFIRNFSTEGQLVAAFVPLLLGRTKSDVTIVALESTELITIDFRFLRERLARHWTWQQIGRVLAERVYLERERRQYELMALSGEERVRSFIASFPNILARISQADMAAFVGVTSQSLSRLRKQIRNG